jgi:hypothetical protein
MDQVRAIAKVIWEQRFWVLSVIGLIVALVCWNLAAGKLDAEFGTRASAINGQFQAMQGLTGKPVHANTDINTENQKQVAKQTEIVNAVWQQLYDRQKEAVLKWPKELGPEFIEGMADKKFRDPIDINLRSIYQNYISNRFDGLLEIVDAKKMLEGSMGGGGRGYGEMDGGRGPMPMEGGDPSLVEEKYLVQWLDQDKLRSRLGFVTSKPSALQIWVTQEDLWVYEALLKVIANTNKARGATRPDNTAIHTIFALEVGASAALGPGASKGMVYLPSGALGGAMAGIGGYEGDGGRGMPMEGGAPSNYEMDGGGRGMGMDGMGGMEGGDPAAADAALLTSRYLDDAGAPLPGEGDLGKEYRQLPIRMDLFMDQRWLPHLLIECANSPLPIEVKQVRINPDKSTMGFGNNMGGSQNMVQGAGPLPTDPNFAQVEIKGVVFIYNEPTKDPNAAPVDPSTQTAAQ